MLVDVQLRLAQIASAWIVKNTVPSLVVMMNIIMRPTKDMYSSSNSRDSCALEVNGLKGDRDYLT
jgi:hypothetical protein